MILEVAAVALANLVTAAPQYEQNAQIDLLRETIGYASAAPEIYLCKGMSRGDAQRAAKRALGRGFDKRLRSAYEFLSTRYGQEAVEAGTEVIGIGWRQTRQRCRLVQSYVSKAKVGLGSLERMNRVH